MKKSDIPFNSPFIVGKELDYISQAVFNGQLAGNGIFTRKCQDYLREKYGGTKVLLTTSCTTALEMTALLCDITSEDEVILPSFTFVSTANAFLLRGAKLKFVDIRDDTLNIDESLIEEAISEKTKVLCPVHYAGIGCEMDVISNLAKEHNLLIVEDAAQAMGSTYRTHFLGTIGHFGAYSFHETKNFISGEGGALVINDPRFVERAEVLWEKGTNRVKFFKGEIDKYTWVDIGSSYLPSELIAAFLYAQFEHTEEITKRRMGIWKRYWEGLISLQEKKLIRLPFVPEHCHHNAHMFYILLRNEKERDALLNYLKENNIHAVFHYIPLHSSPMGLKMGYRSGQLPVTESISTRILRLPMFFELNPDDQKKITETIYKYFNSVPA